MSTTRKLLWGGGVLAGVLLVVLGAVWIYAGATSRSEVHDTITQEQIVGSPDMSPTAILPGLKEAGIEGKVDVPSCSVADDPVTNGAEARCFAEYMRVHALEFDGRPHLLGDGALPRRERQGGVHPGGGRGGPQRAARVESGA